VRAHAPVLHTDGIKQPGRAALSNVSFTFVSIAIEILLSCAGPYPHLLRATQWRRQFGVVEVVVFGGIAAFMGVDINIHTMSTLWQLGFMAMFPIPGVLLFIALLNITSVMK
jgi:hypothetical protein